MRFLPALTFCFRSRRNREGWTWPAGRGSLHTFRIKGRKRILVLGATRSQTNGVDGRCKAERVGVWRVLKSHIITSRRIWKMKKAGGERGE